MPDLSQRFEDPRVLRSRELCGSVRSRRAKGLILGLIRGTAGDCLEGIGFDGGFWGAPIQSTNATAMTQVCLMPDRQISNDRNDVTRIRIGV